MLPTAVRGAAPQCFQAAVQSGSRNLKSGCRKAALLHTCSPKLVFKATSESCSPSCRAKRLRKPPSPKTDVLHCSTKMCPQLSSRAVARKLRFCKRVYQKCPQSHFAKRLPMAPELLRLARKIVSKSGFQKLLPKATPAIESCFLQRLSVNATSMPRSFSQCPKAVLQSVLQSTPAKRLPQSGCSPEQLSTRVPHSDSRKLLPKLPLKLRFFKVAVKSCS